jgi:hypothetical protein
VPANGQSRPKAALISSAPVGVLSTATGCRHFLRRAHHEVHRDEKSQDAEKPQYQFGLIIAHNYFSLIAIILFGRELQAADTFSCRIHGLPSRVVLAARPR